MTAITAVRRSRESGLRSVDLRRDVAGIARLIELCFGDKLDQRGRQALREMRLLSQTGPLLWLFGVVLNDSRAWKQGFVYLKDGRIIGNIGSQLADSGDEAWLIANVAVHPKFRRRGIACQLTQAALDKATEQGGRCMVLQVDDDNGEAIRLYEKLGFDTLASRTIWERRGAPVPRPVKSYAGVELRLTRRDDWPDERALLQEFCPEGLTWTAPFQVDQLKPSAFRDLGHFLGGRREERWGALHRGRVVGWFYLLQSAGANDQLRLLVRPEWRSALEQTLLVAALRRLGRRPWRVRLEYPAGEATDLLPKYQFHPVRTLRWMRKDLR